MTLARTEARAVHLLSNSMNRTGSIVRVWALVLATTAAAATTRAANFVVNSASDSGAGSLRQAILDLNAAGAGSHSIAFDSGLGPINLNDSLPMIVGSGQSVDFQGNGTTLDGNSQHQLFFIASGNMTFHDMSLVNGLAQGGSGGDGKGGGGGGAGAGGAIFINTGANVVIDHITFSNDLARGGAGGNANISGSLFGGGGGGGFRGDGGSTIIGGAAGAGGGGFAGAGGNTASFAGGGGGGAYGHGGSASSLGGGGGGGQGNGQDSTNSTGGDGDGGAPGGAVGQNGAAGTPGGGGGGAQPGTHGSPSPGHGGIGAQYGGGGGGGGSLQSQMAGDGGAGGAYGGGGGAGYAFISGSGGPGGEFGGGGGGATFSITHSDGGNGGDFGGGGGTGISGIAGVGGFGGGNGGLSNHGGSGGNAYGGAIFVRQGGTLAIQNSDISGSGAIGGAGGQGSQSGVNDGMEGTSAFDAVYLDSGVTMFFDVAGSSTSTISDAIAGDGSLTKTGNGTLELFGENSFTGGTVVSAGTLHAQTGSLPGDVVNNATVIMEGFSPDSEWSGQMSGNGELRVVAGRVNFTGDSSAFAGTTTVESDLFVNNRLGGDLTVGPGGLLGGHGTIGGNLVNQNYLWLQKVDGPLQVSGNFTSEVTARIFVALDDGGTTPGVNFGALHVDGTATLNGGIIQVNGIGRHFADGAQYTFLEAGAVVGSFDVIIDTLAFYDASLSYTPTSAYFTLSELHPYEDAARTVNTFAVGRYLDQAAPTANASVGPLLQKLNLVSTSEASNALDSLTGAVSASAAQVGIQNTSIYLQSLVGRLRSGLTDGDGTLADSDGNELQTMTVSYSSNADQPLVIEDSPRCPTTWQYWATGFGLGGNVQSDGNAAALESSLGGTLFGGETMDCCHLFGWYGGYVSNYVGTDAGESAKINGGTLGSYVVGHDGFNYYIAAGGFEFDEYDTTRRIEFADLTTDGDTDGWKGYTYLERGLKFGGPQLQLQPFAALQYIFLRENQFNETAGRGANLHVEGIDAHSLRSIVGSRLAAQQLTRAGRWIAPEVRALWMHELLDPSTTVAAQFTEIGGPSFAVNGLGLGRDWALVGTGVNCDVGNGWQAFAGYDAQFNDRQVFHIGSGGVSYSW